jgi:hypothetical protein
VSDWRTSGARTAPAIDLNSTLAAVQVKRPGTSRWTTRDPLNALTGTPYSYVHDNPLNGADPSGLWLGLPIPSPGEIAHTAGDVFHEALHVALNLAAVPPYARYYAAYKVAHAINSVAEQPGVPVQVLAHTINLPLALIQAQGLSEDALIDWIKGHTVNDESICDEGQESTVYLNPFHEWIPGGPVIHDAPGINKEGKPEIEL